MNKSEVKTVCKENECAGCMACVDVCPKQCIRIKDEIKSYNAVIDLDKCIGCNACRKVCQEVNAPELLKPIYYKQGWATDQGIREKASSGGLATAISLDFVKRGGTVCSCCFKDGEFKFGIAETENEVYDFAGSKYVKSNPQGIYSEIKSRINDGKCVLFIGLPCQVAAVKKFVGDRENLYCIDLICHGTPSPSVLERFLRDYKVNIKDAGKITFRKNTAFFVGLNDKKITVPNVVDDYTMTFLNSTIYTDNCYNCKYAKFERVGDITLGDSWGSELERDVLAKGVSLILCQTEKGMELVKRANVKLLDVDIDAAIKANHQLVHPAEEPACRAEFVRQLNGGKTFKSAVRKCYFKKYVKDILRTFKYKTSKLIKR